MVERLGKTAYPFSLEVASLAPPSVQLVPAKRYCGAPIGTSYDIRVHLGKMNKKEFLHAITKKETQNKKSYSNCKH